MDIAYQKATCADLDGIYAVETQCFLTPWSKPSLKSDLCKNKHALYIVGKAGEQITGFCGVHLIFNEGHIMNVAVLKEFRGNGIGKGLLHAMFEHAPESIDSYTLEVRAGNSAAIALYKKFGFQCAGLRPQYYSDTGEDALIMWKNML